MYGTVNVHLYTTTSTIPDEMNLGGGASYSSSWLETERYQFETRRGRPFFTSLGELVGTPAGITMQAPSPLPALLCALLCLLSLRQGLL